MQRWYVTMASGAVWELAAPDSVQAAARAERVHFERHGVDVAAQIVQTVAQYQAREAELAAAEYAALGVVVTDAGVIL